MAILLSGLVATGGKAAQRPPTDRHVAELGQFFNGVKIAAPIVEQRLAIYPVLVDDVPMLHGAWQTLDEAITRGTLAIREKGGGTVPVVSVENRSKEAYILLMMGDVIKGGMQTRTVRHDTVLGPGQRLDLEVFCVEAHRWQGEKGFSAANAKVPQSIQNELRRGGSQAEVWRGVARNNASLGAENDTGSLERALKSPPWKGNSMPFASGSCPRSPAVRSVSFLSMAAGPWGPSSLAARNWPGPSSPNCWTPTRSIT